MHIILNNSIINDTIYCQNQKQYLQFRLFLMKMMVIISRSLIPFFLFFDIDIDIVIDIVIALSNSW